MNKNTKRLAEQFPNVGYYLSSYGARNHAELIALILFLAGTKTIEHSVTYLSGDKSPENLVVHDNSITSTPYIESPKERECLLWYLLKKSEVFSCGCAKGEGRGNYSQASCDFKKADTYRAIVRYFNALKAEFPKKKKRAKYA